MTARSLPAAPVFGVAVSALAQAGRGGAWSWCGKGPASVVASATEGPARIVLTASLPGCFEAELEEPQLGVAELEEHL